MTEHPILFSAPMVRALLAGTKTQTRRVCKPQPDIVAEGGTTVGVFTPDDQRLGRLGKALSCPYGQPGDRLWVREAWRTTAAYDRWAPRDLPGNVALHFDADGRPSGHLCMGRLRASMHLPRAASRITLEITGVRVERLQEISKADAIAEGVEWNKCPTQQTQQSMDAQRAAHRIGMAAHHEAWIDYVGGYRWLWESINGPGSWDANPWVWVIEFRPA